MKKKVTKIKIRGLLSEDYSKAIEIPVKFSFKEPVFTFDLLKKSLVKFAAFILIVALNWSGLSAVIQTIASFNDTEDSPQNTFVAGTLDFSLASPADFLPSPILPGESAARTIHFINYGNAPKYKVYATSTVGAPCDYLTLQATLDGTTTYSGNLKDFESGINLFGDPDNWTFTATLNSNAPASVQGQTCNFKFVFFGSQERHDLPLGQGFNDTEEIDNTITVGVWQKVVINKVYYDVCPKYGVEPDNEWVELYNVTQNPVDLSGWKICDNHLCDTLPDSYVIPAGGFTIVTDSSTTWNYWDIPPEVIKITLNSPIGNGLGNDADMLILKDEKGNIMDQMNWGTPIPAWPNYNANVWNPGAPDVPKGHMLARVPTGIDTDTASDWHDLGVPQATVLWPNGGEVLWVGHTETLHWSATNSNGDNNLLTIDLWYSKDSGATWAIIATSTENDGAYDWRIPLCLDDGHGGCYYVPSHNARIKVVAKGPENFMVQNWDMSDYDFCPPIDYALLTPEEIEMLKEMGLFEETAVGQAEEQPAAIGNEEAATTTEEIATTTEEIATSTEETATPTEEIITPVGNDSAVNGNQESGGVIETMNGVIGAADGAINTMVDGIVEEIMPDQPVSETAEIPAENLAPLEAVVQPASAEPELILESAPAIEPQPAITTDNSSAGPPSGE